MLTGVQPVKLTPPGLRSTTRVTPRGDLAYIKPFPLRAEETGVSSIAKHNW